MTKPHVNLKKLVEELKLNVLHMPEREVLVTNANVNRPGLPLTGFFEHFEPSRMQIIGKSEFNYLYELEPDVRKKRLRQFLCREPIAIVYSTGMYPSDEMMELVNEFDVPLLQTERATSEFMAALISKLSVYLAPCITRHGVLVEVYGEGVLILGDSGVGKSETAIELVKRGHRLIADDAVELRRVSDRTITGTAPELIRHYIELRGIGVIDVRRIFGIGAVKDVEKVDLVINLEPWVEGKMYDRLGLEEEYTDIMGLKIVSNTIPVHPGRNMAVIIEIAAINNRQKRMGYNTAKEFNDRLMKNMGM
ncbi:MAG: HPr(Ser) kinase/phosphatase [Clostridia bacterium]|nr:HPr(Ser) kinase/phosphatase [Clostridia bacterium]